MTLIVCQTEGHVMVRGCLGGYSCVVGVCVYQIIASFSSLWAAVRCAQKRIVNNIMKMYMYRKEEHAS